MIFIDIEKYNQKTFEDIKGQEKSDTTHYNIGKKVRETMKEISGVLPEELLTPEKSIKQIEKEKNKKIDK